MTGPIVGVEMPEAGMGMRTGFRRETHESQSFLVVCDEPVAPLAMGLARRWK